MERKSTKSIDNVKKFVTSRLKKRGYFRNAYSILGLGRLPMLISDERITQLTHIIGDFEPTVILTHSEKDPFNPDHPLAFQATQRARLLSCGAGVPSAFKNIDPPAWYSFEPHQPELCGFLPDTYIDITSVMDKKMAAMDCMGAQKYLRDYYAELASRRGNHARRISGQKMFSLPKRIKVKYQESLIPFLSYGFNTRTCQIFGCYIA
jgi:4-oxalomesaconate hydratase